MREDSCPEKQLVQAEEARMRRIWARQLVAALPPRQREVVQLRYFNGLTPEEISEVMDIRYQTVVNHLCEALKSLRHKHALSEMLN